LNLILVKLLLLRLRGGVRQRLQELKTLRGLLFLLVTVAVFALIKIQPALPVNPSGSIFSSDLVQLRGQMAQYMPIGLLAAFLLTVFLSPSACLYFSPSEINLLFSGPFTRRALLLYKLGSYAFGALLSSLLIMLLVPTSSYSSQATFLGVFLTLLFMQLLTVATGLLGQWLRRYLCLRVKCSYLIISTLILLIAATGWYYADVSSGLTGVLTQFQASMGGALLLAPFNVFAHIFLSKSIFPDLFTWATLGLAMNVGLVTVVILLDRHSCEASIAASLERHKRWDRTRRSGLPWGANPLIARSLMQPPMLGGIGPIVWRQMLSAFRSSSNVLLAFLAIAIVAGPLLVIASADVSKWSLIGGVFVAAIFVLPRTLIFDFRSDLDIMQNFKALPLSAWKISIGQLVSPVLLTSLIELVLLGSAAILLDSQSRFFLIGISPFLVPFNMLLYGVENLFFLLFPAPLVPIGRADFDFIGRTIVGYAITTTILIGSCFLAAGAGYLAVNAMGLPWHTFVVVAWLSLTLIALMTLPLLSWAYNRFDVSRW
jgi:hypothetical protein